MPEPIIYRFQADSHGEVVSAIKSIQQAALEGARAQETLGRSATGASREVVRGASAGKRGLTELQRLALKVAADQERAAKKAAAAQEKAAHDAVKAANKSGQEQEKAFKKAAAAAEKAEEKKAQATKRAEEQRWREVERTAARIQREMDREAAAAERLAERKARAEQKARSRIVGSIGGALGNLGGMALSGLGNLAGSAVGVVGDVIGHAVRGSVETQDIANRVSINARMPGQEAVDPNQLRKEFEAASIATPGVSAQEIGKAAQAYVDLTGDLNTARGSLKTFATVASATGASVEDVATAAASLGKQFDVKKVEDMQKVFAGLTAQGKGGAMTMKDLAAQFQKLAAAANAFGIGKGPEAVAKLGGLVQIARTGTRSPQQAGTAVENIFTALTSHQKNLSAAGVKLFGKGGEKRDINEILAETISKVGGSDAGLKSAGLTKIFGRQGMRAINPLLAAEMDATKGKTGPEAQKAGYEAVMKALKQASDAATDFSEVERDAAQAQQSVAAQLQGAWSQLEAAAGEKLAPKLAELANRLASDGKVIDLFVAAIEAAANALEAFAAFAQKMGWISGGSAAEKADKAEKVAAAEKAKLDKMGGDKGYAHLSKAEQQRYREINAKYLTAKAVAVEERAKADIAAGASAVASKEGEGGKTAAAAYKKLGGTGAHTAAKILGTITNWTTLQGLFGSKDFTKDDSTHRLFGETLEQGQVRHAAEAKGQDVGASVSNKQSAAAMDEVTKAAREAAKALASVKAPAANHSIAPGANH